MDELPDASAQASPLSRLLAGGCRCRREAIDAGLQHPRPLGIVKQRVEKIHQRHVFLQGLADIIQRLRNRSLASLFVGVLLEQIQHRRENRRKDASRPRR